MRLALVTVVLFTLVGCSSDETALRKRVDQLERRLEALERGGRRGGSARREARADKVSADQGPKGKVELTGDAAKVALLHNGSRFEVPGEIPAGSYQIVARFGEERVEAGKLDVVADQTIVLDCASATKTCAPK